MSAQRSLFLKSSHSFSSMSSVGQYMVSIQHARATTAKTMHFMHPSHTHTHAFIEATENREVCPSLPLRDKRWASHRFVEEVEGGARFFRIADVEKRAILEAFFRK